MKPETKREILIAREAFKEGWSAGYTDGGLGSEVMADKIVKQLYPLPKSTRPRVLTDALRTKYKVEGKRIYFSSIHFDWTPVDNGGPFVIDAERAAIFHDLFQNPTEEVEDDG